jgi:sarcosine oxidase subunit beta
MQQTTAIVIGAGIIGCAIAFELSKKDYQVLVIDKNEEVGFGSTANSCAIVRTCYSTYDGVAMAYEGLHYWRDWANYLQVEDERGLSKFVECGMCQLIAPDGHWERVKPHYNAIGIKYEEWNVAEASRKMPMWTTGAHYPPTLPNDDAFWQDAPAELPGVAHVPGEGYINDPVLATHNLRRAAENVGAKFVLGRAVTAVRRDEEKVLGVTLDNGRQIDAPVVVNVAGPHSFVINRMAGVEAGMNITTRALRHEVHFVPAPDGIDYQSVGTVTSDNDSGIYFRPETGNLILVGSGDPPCDPLEWVDDPDNFNRSVTEERWQAQTYRLARRFKNMRLPNQMMGVVDLYDVTDDWIPVYDKTDLSGYYLAIGTSGNQFKNAGPVGQLMAELIDRCQRGHDHDAEPVKITGRYTGLELNAGFYSRNRPVNKSSSFSVLG